MIAKPMHSFRDTPGVMDLEERQRERLGNLTYLRLKISNSWRNASALVKLDNTWRTVGQVYAKVNGTWRALWSYSWATDSWGNCSAACGGGTQTRTVTCQRNDGVTVTDSLCTKFVGAKPTVSQSCNTQNCITCFYSTSSPSYYVYQSDEDQSPECTRNVPTGYWNGSHICSKIPCTIGGYIYTRGNYVTGSTTKMEEEYRRQICYYYICRQ